MVNNDSAHAAQEAKDDVRPKVDLDSILTNEVGQFGLFQLKNIALLGIVIILNAWGTNEFIFTAGRVNTRCLIPECESPASAQWSPPWLEHAVPAAGAGFDNCRRFGNTTYTYDAVDLVCPASLFNQQSLVECEQYVYEHTNTAVYDLGLACKEWQWALIGSLRTVGTLISLPFVGFMSDCWGRRMILITVTVNAGILGTARYWTNTYEGFIATGVLECILGAGTYITVYTLVMESVGSKYRVIAGTIIITFWAVGKMTMGLIAWAVPNWRHLTLIFYVPQLLIIFYFWILSESIRWYISKGRYEEAEELLRTVAHVNGKQLSEKSLIMLRQSAENEKVKQMQEKQNKMAEPWLIVLIFRHKAILLRCLVTPVLWITAILIYYGLTINAVNISGNMYVNFVLVAAVEIPGYWIPLILATRVGRKLILIVAFWICAACQIAYLFMPVDHYGASLTVYLIGMCSNAVTVSTIYTYTAELYPTSYRNSMLAYSSMMGRIGSIVAPLTPAFGTTVPYILFASFGLVSGLLVLILPETMNTKLVDTMEEASRLGKEKTNV